MIILIILFNKVIYNLKKSTYGTVHDLKKSQTNSRTDLFLQIKPLFIKIRTHAATIPLIVIIWN